MATSKKADKKSAPKVKTAAKPTTKKTAPKKTTAKKSTVATSKKAASKKTKQSGKVLVCANGKECFWTRDGQVLKDLTELRDALKAMNDKVFAYHVTKDKNDFADWVEQVLKDAACATDLRKSKKPNTSRVVIVRHLRTYKR